MTGGERTDFGRPTSAWLRQFVGELEERALAYESELDVQRKRVQAAHIVGCIAAYLKLIPAFRGSDCLLPVKDVLVFLHALDSGSGHPWAKPVNFGGTNRETKAETEVRVWVVMGVWMLMEAGYRPNAAYKYMANVMTVSGRRSKGGPFSHNNVKRWWHMYQNGGDERLQKVNEHIRDFWGQIPCIHGFSLPECQSSGGGRCVEMRATAESFASMALSHTELRDWFVSS